MTGKKLGHYELLERIGVGGMGQVYLALDTRLQRKVAIKLLSEDLAADPERLQRFFREAKTISALNHPNILTLHEIGNTGKAGDTPYLVTEMVEGKTLRKIIQEGALDAATAIDIAAQAASGLAKAHEAGIIHRDIKPENLMVTADGFVKILDFGLAKLVGAEGALTDLHTAENLTASGAILGTPAYLSVEQLQGKPVDGRSDLFSLGIVLHEMITGKNPFLRDSLAETLSAILHQKPPRLDARIEGLPRGLAEIVAKALCKRPADRFADAAQMAAALRRLQSGTLSEVPGVRGPRSRSKSLLFGVPAAAVVLIAAAFFLRGGLPPRDAARNPDGSRPSRALIRPATGAHIPQGRLGIAILPFGTSESSKSDPSVHRTDIGQILADAFIQILADVPEFYVISPQRLEGIARSQGRTLVEAARDPLMARKIAEESQASAMLSGKVSQLGESFVLNATLIRLPDEIVLENFQVDSPTIEGLLGDLGERLGDSIRPQSPQASLASETFATSESLPTRSLEAYELYLKGEDMVLEGNWDAAVPNLEEAVEIDPEMTQAWSALSCAFSFMGDDVKARAAYMKASEQAGRVNERERRWIKMDGVWVNTGNGGLYMELMEQYIRDFPDNPRSYFYAGLAMEWLHDDPDSALTWYRQSLEMSPAYYPVIKAMVDCTEKLGRREQSVRVLTEYLDRPHIGGYGRKQAQERLAGLAASGTGGG